MSTLTSSHTRGTTAMRNARVTSTVAIWFLTLREVETLRKVSGTAGRSGASRAVDISRSLSFPRSRWWS